MALATPVPCLGTHWFPCLQVLLDPPPSDPECVPADRPPARGHRHAHTVSAALGTLWSGCCSSQPRAGPPPAHLPALAVTVLGHASWLGLSLFSIRKEG